MSRRRAAPLRTLLLVAFAAAGGSAPRAVHGAAPADLSRYVALGDGITAGFVNNNLFDGSTADPPLAMGQRESYAARLAESLGTTVVLPLVGWPGLAAPGRNTRRRTPGTCSFDLDDRRLPYEEIDPADDGAKGRIDPAARATVVAVPGQGVTAAIGTRWSASATAPSDIGAILATPWASESEPPRSQLETALALRPTFASVWFGVDQALSAVQVTGSEQNLASAQAYADGIERIVGDLAAAGARGVVATVPDVTSMPYLMPEEELRDLLQTLKDRESPSHRAPRIPHVALLILFGVQRHGYVVREKYTFQAIAAVDAGDGDVPLPPNQRLTVREARRVRRRIGEWNDAVRATAARHGWAVADVASQFDGWREKGADVLGTHLTNGYLGGLFDLTGRSLTPTAQALVAETFAAAIDAEYGTSHTPVDVAAVLGKDPLAPCAR